MGARLSGYEQPDPPIQGWMCNEELQWLYEMAQGMASIVEVGSWKGRSTHALCSGSPGVVVAVDHFGGSAAEQETNHREAKQRDIAQDFWTNCGKFKNLSILRMESKRAASLFQPKSIDMVFIDGGHTLDEVAADLEQWRPIARKLLCGHDIGYGDIVTALDRAGLKYEVPTGCIWKVTNL